MALPKLYKYRYFNEKLVSRNNLPDGEKIPQWQSVMYDGLIIPASPKSFNDPFDCEFLLEDSFLHSQFARRMLIAHLSKRCSLSSKEREMLEKADDIEKALKAVLWTHFRAGGRGLAKRMMADLDTAIKQAKDALLVACLSETNNSVLMWSHYASNHTGFVIEYDLNNWDCKKHIKPVQYVTERHYIQGSFADNWSPGAGNAIMDAALYKSVEWSYEKEWRLVMSRLDIAHPEFKGLTPACFLKNYITAVYLGAKAESKFCKQVCDHYHGTDVKVYQMQMEANSYKLEAKLIQ